MPVPRDLRPAKSPLVLGGSSVTEDLTAERSTVPHHQPAEVRTRSLLVFLFQDELAMDRPKRAAHPHPSACLRIREDHLRSRGGLRQCNSAQVARNSTRIPGGRALVRLGPTRANLAPPALKSVKRHLPGSR